MVTGASGTSTRRPIILSGLVSGFDTASLINQLIEGKRGAITAAQAQISTRQQHDDALRDVSTRLTNLLSQSRRFTDGSIVQGKTAGVAAGGAAGSTAGISASAGPSATAGAFKVTVNQLADATRVSGPTAIGAAIDSAALLKDANLATPVMAGSFTVNGASITIDPAVDSLDAVMQRIRDAVPGITVSLTLDADGRNNRLQIAHPAGVTLGAGGDNSNFLGATKLLAAPGGVSRTSTGNLGVVKTGLMLSSTALVTPLSTSSGSFQVNGVAIDYDSTRDSLSTVLSRISNSTAGVTAAYDAATDRVTLSNRKTGSTTIQLADVSGNFLDVIGVRATAQTLGKNAEFQIDSGNGNVTYYSNTNIVPDVLPGVTLTLLKTTTTADTVNIGQDTGGALSAMKDFVSQLNSTLDFLNKQTDFSTTGANGPLAGDSGVQNIAANLRLLVTGKIDGVTSGKRTLADVGLSFGVVGSKVGTANTLTLDEGKFRAAIDADPAGVANLFTAFRASAALRVGGTGGVQAIDGDPTGLRRPGVYSLTTEINGDGTGKITALFKPRDGSTSVTSTVDNVAAGSTNTTLISGVTLTFKGALTAGTDTLDIATPTRGVAVRMEQFLDPLARAGGTMQQRRDTVASNIKDMKARIDRMNDRLDKERDLLQSKFARMEMAMARAQSQKSSLSALASLYG